MEAKIREEVLQVISALPKRIREHLLHISPSLLDELTEIRLRANGPILLASPARTFYITVGGKPTYMPSEHLFCVTQHEIQDIVTHVCGYSVHSHQEDFKNGYLILTGGHRIGLCGTAVTENGKVIGIREISALNIRITKKNSPCRTGNTAPRLSKRFAESASCRCADVGQNNRFTRFSQGIVGRIYRNTCKMCCYR